MRAGQALDGVPHSTLGRQRGPARTSVPVTSAVSPEASRPGCPGLQVVVSRVRGFLALHSQVGGLSERKKPGVSDLPLPPPPGLVRQGVSSIWSCGHSTVERRSEPLTCLSLANSLTRWAAASLSAPLGERSELDAPSVLWFSRLPHCPWGRHTSWAGAEPFIDFGPRTKEAQALLPSLMLDASGAAVPPATRRN